MKLDIEIDDFNNNSYNSWTGIQFNYDIIGTNLFIDA